MDDLTSSICELFLEAGMQVGVVKTSTNAKKVNAPRYKNHQPWFDHDCNKARSQYYKIKRRKKKWPSPESEQSLKSQTR